MNLHGTAELDLTPGPAHWLVRKKPVEVEAMHYNSFNGDEVAKWCGGRLIFGRTTNGISAESYYEIQIQTLEGDMYAGVGDWIIKGVKGEFYPCNPDIFTATYEPVREL